MVTIVDVENILKDHNNTINNEVVKEVMAQSGGVLSSSKMNWFGLSEQARSMLYSKELIYGRCDEGNWYFGLPERKQSGNTDIGWLKEPVLKKEEFDMEKFRRRIHGTTQF